MNNFSADEVVSEAQTLYDRWPDLPTDNKRKIAESIIEKIVIGDGEIDITLSYLPSSGELTKSQQQLIQLLGFAQRKIHASHSHIAAHRRGRKPFPTTLKSFGDRLRAKRLEMGLTQQELAQKLEVSKFQIGLWERGLRKPTASESYRLECVLGASCGLLERNPTAE